MPHCPRRHPETLSLCGFTLLELLVSMVILTMLMGVCFVIVSSTNDIYAGTSGKAAAFREARSAFEALSRRISQATLNTYFDYVDSQNQTRRQCETAGAVFQPKSYARQSELHFVIGQAAELLDGAGLSANPIRPGHGIFFHAPAGYCAKPGAGDAQLSNLLNALGFYVEYGSDEAFRPAFLDGFTPPKNRYRLMQITQSSEKLHVYAQEFTRDNRFDWFRSELSNPLSSVRPLADNVVACIFWAHKSALDTPVLSLTEGYTYDSKGYLEVVNDHTALSRNQLPPMVRAVLVGLDEKSAARLERVSGNRAPLLQPGSLFTEAPDTEDTLSRDLKELEKFLSEEHYNYRVFSTDITIRQAKFNPQ